MKIIRIFATRHFLLSTRVVKNPNYTARRRVRTCAHPLSRGQAEMIHDSRDNMSLQKHHVSNYLTALRQFRIGLLHKIACTQYYEGTQCTCACASVQRNVNTQNFDFTSRYESRLRNSTIAFIYIGKTRTKPAP